MNISRIGPPCPPAPFRIELERRGSAIVLVVYGEIDLSSADRLNARLKGLLSSSSRIVLDLREIDFIDSAGLHCILDVDRASRDAGVEFLLVPGPMQARRLFDVTGTERLLRFAEPGRFDRG